MESSSEPRRIELKDLPDVWAALDEREQQFQRAADQHQVGMDFTDRRFDEASQTGRRAYIQAHGFIMVARDNQKALEEMLHRSHARPYAVWNLIRPAFEASFYAVWILEARDGRERLRRALRLAWDAHRQNGLRRNLKIDIADIGGNEEVLRAQQRHRETTKLYLEEAGRLGMSRASVGKQVNLVDEIPKLESLSDRTGKIEDFALLTWRELSGVQHADMGASLALSDKTYRVKIPGGFTAEITINDDSFYGACQTSALMQLTAMNLYIQRSRSASS